MGYRTRGGCQLRGSTASGTRLPRAPGRPAHAGSGTNWPQVSWPQRHCCPELAADEPAIVVPEYFRTADELNAIGVMRCGSQIRLDLGVAAIPVGLLRHRAK